MPKPRERRGPKKEPAMNLEDRLSRLAMDNKQNINILFLGETGVGKSTFINSFYSYFKYDELKNAMKDEPKVLIPAKFTIMDENYKQQTVEVGEDENERFETGASATQTTKSYIFPIRERGVNICLIDTPGIGDTRGIDWDNKNFDNILDFIGKLKHLNGICILLKPENPRLTVQFEYCIKQLLSKLDKSACNNLMFVFTNSRRTFYRPGECLLALQKMLDGIQNAKIPLLKKNIFCVDNEAFRFWTAHYNGIKFSSDDIESFARSWNTSIMECCRMIDYIAGTHDNSPLEPHLVQNTISINETRRYISCLFQQFDTIAHVMQDAISCLQRFQNELQSSDLQIRQLSEKLHIPFVNVRVTKLDQPATVCTSTMCSEFYEVNGVKRWHYKQVCHSPCSLSDVPKELIGSPLLAKCVAMAGLPWCKICRCEYQKHMHISYHTETFKDTYENKSVKSIIAKEKLVWENAKVKIEQFQPFLFEYKKEMDTILKTTAKFANFLQTNSVTSYDNDNDREKLLRASRSDNKVNQQLKCMFNCYKEEKNLLNNGTSGQQVGAKQITEEEVIESVNTLCTLKHNGDEIKQLFLYSKSACEAENKGQPPCDASNISSNTRSRKQLEQFLPEAADKLTDTEHMLQQPKHQLCDDSSDISALTNNAEIPDTLPDYLLKRTVECLLYISHYVSGIDENKWKSLCDASNVPSNVDQGSSKDIDQSGNDSTNISSDCKIKAEIRHDALSAPSGIKESPPMNKWNSPHDASNVLSNADQGSPKNKIEIGNDSVSTSGSQKSYAEVLCYASSEVKETSPTNKFKALHDVSSVPSNVNQGSPKNRDKIGNNSSDSSSGSLYKGGSKKNNCQSLRDSSTVPSNVNQGPPKNRDKIGNDFGDSSSGSLRKGKTEILRGGSKKNNCQSLRGASTVPSNVNQGPPRNRDKIGNDFGDSSSGSLRKGGSKKNNCQSLRDASTVTSKVVEGPSKNTDQIGFLKSFFRWGKKE